MEYPEKSAFLPAGISTHYLYPFRAENQPMDKPGDIHNFFEDEGLGKGIRASKKVEVPKMGIPGILQISQLYWMRFSALKYEVKQANER